MPTLLPQGNLFAKYVTINGAAQAVISGPVLYFGMRALNLSGAAATTITVTDGTTAGGPIIDMLRLAVSDVGGTDSKSAPVRTESGIFCDAGGAGNATIVIYYLPLEYVATMGGVVPEDYFAEVG